MTTTLTTAAGKIIGGTLSTVKHLLYKTVSHADACIASYAEHKLDHIYETRKNKAMLNSEYVEIENRRKPENNDGTVILISEQHNLTWEDFETQNRIYNEASSEPYSAEIYKKLATYPITSTIQSCKHIIQRITRGWDDTATWSLDNHLCETLSAQLKHIAETTHGWPQSKQYPEFSDWKNTLLYHAENLANYSERWNFETEETVKQQEEKYVKAQQSLHWVADNLEALWD